MKETTLKKLKNQSIEKILNNVLDFSRSNTISFASWRLPNSSTINLMVQFSEPEKLKSIDLENSGQGFVFSPFNRDNHKLFIKNEFLLHWNATDDLDVVSSKKCEKLLEHINDSSDVDSNFNLELNQPIDSNSFKDLVRQSVTLINQGLFAKVVPSRKRVIDIDGTFDSGLVFKKLTEQYQSAFVSMVYTPNSGLWMGATPELLISTENEIFKTVALAGTQKIDANYSLADTAWTQKEIEEQALVSRYIINCFKKIRLREFEEHGPKTIKAGNLIHLKTEFKVDMKATNFSELGTTMLDLLHPTSAVCGMPMQSAQDFLLNNEGYDREFYSGYLGPVNIENKTAQFVNLRCMKIDQNQISLFAGAGVTEDSNPEKEWLETELKMNTLLNVINTN